MSEYNIILQNKDNDIFFLNILNQSYVIVFLLF